MKGFKIKNGDVVISNDIEIVHDIEFVAQIVQYVVNTNLGEWFEDKKEGIDFDLILTKSPNYELIEDAINTAVQFVAETLNIELETDSFEFNLSKDRHLHISFLIKADFGETAVNMTL